MSSVPFSMVIYKYQFIWKFHKDSKNTVCKLKNLLDVCFTRSQSDPCLYFVDGIYLIFHVDYLILFTKSVAKYKNKLMSRFYMKDLTPEMSDCTTLKFTTIITTKDCIFIK